MVVWESSLRISFSKLIFTLSDFFLFFFGLMSFSTLMSAFNNAKTISLIQLLFILFSELPKLAVLTNQKRF